MNRFIEFILTFFCALLGVISLLMAFLAYSEVLTPSKTSIVVTYSAYGIITILYGPLIIKETFNRNK